MDSVASTLQGFIKILVFTLSAEKVPGMLAEGVSDEDCPLNVVWSFKNEPL